METALSRFIHEVKKNNLLVLYALVYKDGKEIDRWSRFYSEDSALTGFRGLSRFESYSTAKSVSGLGVGIAIDEGLISLDEKVADSFPELTYDIADPNALDITVEDMLKMSSGLSDPLFFRDSPERATVRDWPRYFYEKGQFVRRPGTKFLYSNFNTYMLGCLVERKAGVNLLEYMRFRLFEPLGIGNPDMTTCPKGHTVAANGMAINVEELNRIGRLLLNKGVYNNKRIVSEKFVLAATSPLIKTDIPPFWPSANETLDYGYQLWVDTANNCSFLYGILGQFCLVLPDINAVVTVQALEQNERLLGSLLWEHVVQQL
jgi:CubicO group peptidase (beta-lactamase class C family)